MDCEMMYRYGDEEMKKVVNFIKDYWITALICVGFVLLYKYISDHKLFSALMFPPLKMDERGISRI